MVDLYGYYSNEVLRAKKCVLSYRVKLDQKGEPKFLEGYNGCIDTGLGGAGSWLS